MRRDDAVEDIQGITAVSVSVGIDGQAAYTSFLVGFIQCGVLRSDCILSSKRALREIISERVVQRNQYLALGIQRLGLRTLPRYTVTVIPN